MESTVKASAIRRQPEKAIEEIARFDALYEEYKISIYSYARYLTKNETEAEDLFQKTWLRVVQNPPKPTDVKNLKAWIFTITTNLYRDNLRKLKVRKLFIQQKTAFAGLSGGIVAVEDRGGKMNVSKEIEQAETQKALSQALSRLPEKLRRVFVLKEIEGFKYLEISEILGVPIGTVKSMTHRAIHKLRQELALYCPD